MKELMSYCWYPGEPRTRDELARILLALKLDGVERLIYKAEPEEVHFPQETVGVHLMYWPYWMDFWQGNKDALAAQFDSEDALRACYGGTTPEAWLETIRKNIRAALVEKPEYLVWHVAHSTMEETYTWRFHYSSRDVLKEAARVFNVAADEVPPEVTVLFENLWWPGLTLLDPSETDYFFSLINRPQVGIILDTGHMMNSNPDLITEDDGADYICSHVKQLGSLGSLIRGLHMSRSLSGTYQKTFSHTFPSHPTMVELMSHIISIDQHLPFQTDAIRRIVDLVEPDYAVHELISRDKEDPQKELRIQVRSLHGNDI